MSNKARVAEYKKLLRETAKQLGQPITVEVVHHLTAFKVLRSNLLARMLNGEVIDPGHLLKCDEVLKAYLPAGEPLKVNVRFVSDRGPETSPPDDPPPNAPKPPDKPLPDAPAALPALAAANVVQLPQRMGVSASSFHDTVLPNGEIPPLKKLQERGYRPPTHAHTQFGPGVLTESDPVSNYTRSRQLSVKYNGY